MPTRLPFLDRTEAGDNAGKGIAGHCLSDKLIILLFWQHLNRSMLLGSGTAILTL